MLYATTKAQVLRQVMLRPCIHCGQMVILPPVRYGALIATGDRVTIKIKVLAEVACITCVCGRPLVLPFGSGEFTCLCRCTWWSDMFGYAGVVFDPNGPF
jgi:hypothetical protein